MGFLSSALTCYLHLSRCLGQAGGKRAPWRGKLGRGEGGTLASSGSLSPWNEIVRGDFIRKLAGHQVVIPLSP